MNLGQELKFVETDELVRELSLEYPDIPLDFLIRHMMRAVAEACRDGDLDRRVQGVETRPGVSNYKLDLDEGYELAALVDVACLEGGDAGRRILKFPHPPERAFHGGVGVWLEPGNLLHIESSARNPSLYRAEFSVCPPFNALEINADFKTKYYEAVYSGARHFIHSNTGPLFNPAVAGGFGAMFRNAVRAAKIDKARGGMRGTGRIANKRIL